MLGLRTTTRHTIAIACFCCGSAALVPSLPAVAGEGRPFDLATRVDYQMRVDEVLWRHRTWPAENPGPRPDPRSLVSADASRAVVEDALRQSRALEEIFGQPLTGEDLQGELERIVLGSQQPTILAEIFAALDNDPFVIAEVLARPPLAARRLASARASAVGATTTRAHATRPDENAIESSLRAQSEMSDWWATQRDRIPAAIETPQRSYALPALPAAACQPGQFTKVLGADLPSPRRHHTAVWTGSELLVQGGEADGFFRGDLWSYNPATDVWQQRAIGGGQRARHIAIWTGTEMVVWGGYGWDSTLNFDNELNTGAAYNPATNSWRTLTVTPQTPTARHGHTAVWTGSQIVVWGGESGDYPVGTAVVGTGARLTPGSGVWTPLPDLPPARTGHIAVWTGSEMLLYGGRNANASIAYNDLYSFNPVNGPPDQWSERPSSSIAGRYDHIGVWLPGQPGIAGGLILYGGYQAGGFLATDGARFDPSTNEHFPIGLSNDLIVEARAVRSDNTTLYAFGGAYAAWQRFSLASGQWETLPDNTLNQVPNQERTGHTFTLAGNRLIAWGGRSLFGNSALDDGGRFPLTGNPDSNWQPMFNLQGMPQRYYHSAVWTGVEMVLWGGIRSDALGLEDGARYNPATNTWTLIPINPPAGAGLGPRWQNTAVWTGTRMIVWGGRAFFNGLAPQGSPQGDGYFYYDDGASYDPSANNWTYLPSLDRPTGRSGHTAVWTGTEMLIWGGWNGSAVLATGAAFNPQTNLWSALPTTNAPESRERHTAVLAQWGSGPATQRRMIIFGGAKLPFSVAGALNSGAMFDVATRQWTALPLVEAPSPRTYHTAVWTGSRMLVWGGISPEAYLATGGAFDPMAQQWHPMSAVDAPVGRYGHAAVWTGAQMVVWGGYTPSNFINTGAVYDPAGGGVWRVIGPEGGGRYLSTGIFTGDELLVAGGYPLWNDSVRFCPLAAVPRRAVAGTITHYRERDAEPPTTARPVAGISVASFNEASQRFDDVVTAADGTFLQPDLADGVYRLKPWRLESLPPRAVSAFDAHLTLESVVGNVDFSLMQKRAADVNGDASVDSLDALTILRYAIGKLTRFTRADQLVPKSDWIFEPPQRNYASLPSDLSGENFVAALLGDVSGSASLPVAPPAAERAPAVAEDPAPPPRTRPRSTASSVRRASGTLRFGTATRGQTLELTLIFPRGGSDPQLELQWPGDDWIVSQHFDPASGRLRLAAIGPESPINTARPLFWSAATTPLAVHAARVESLTIDAELGAGVREREPRGKGERRGPAARRGGR